MGQYIATGGTADVLAKAASVVSTVQVALEDPALPEVVCQANRLSKIADGKDAGGPCRPTVVTAANKNKGIGLNSALPALRAFVWIRENPVLATAVLTSAFGLFWYFGYSVGHRRGKNKVGP